MKTEHVVRVAAPRERVWAFLLDVPAAARCVPGVEDVVPSGDAYRGKLRVQVGPIRLAIEGEVRVIARDDAAGTATLRLEGTDRRLGGGVRAEAALAVSGSAPTDVRITSDVAVLGRLGELGQPLMQRKADETMNAFASCLERALGSAP
ncbi:MAG TPA: SRPBCC domain-containing protein [Candidatus Limnocylindria bacterium]|nr:SRPBCC domain-containing protein [Candidatus Limnocylindria bacterium]